MKIPLPRLLILLNVAVLVILALLSVDKYVRWRAEQAIVSYHTATIVPLITPRPAPAPPAAPR